MVVITSTDRPKSVRNRCVIEVSGGVSLWNLKVLTCILRLNIHMALNFMLFRFFCGVLFIFLMKPNVSRISNNLYSYARYIGVFDIMKFQLLVYTLYLSVTLRFN